MAKTKRLRLENNRDKLVAMLATLATNASGEAAQKIGLVSVVTAVIDHVSGRVVLMAYVHPETSMDSIAPAVAESLSQSNWGNANASELLEESEIDSDEPSN